jgi:hypothetical protein
MLTPRGPSRSRFACRQQRKELVARRQARALQQELAVAYGIHVETVCAIICRSERS